MPVLATPVPADALVTCCPPAATAPASRVAVSPAGLSVVSSNTSTDNGTPLTTRLQAVQLKQKQLAIIDWTFQTAEGRPVDLTDLAAVDPTQQIVFRLKEYSDSGTVTDIPVTITDAPVGKVQATLTASHTATPGIYFGEFVLQSINSPGSDTPTTDLYSNLMYVNINRTTSGDSSGPPTIAEIRLHLRDSHAGESYLLNRLRFDDAEIAAAITRPIDYFNEVLPNLGYRFNTQNFPWRYFWMDAIVANLFLMVAEQFRANALNVTAGGLAVNDQGKEQPYEAAADRRMVEWRTWVRGKKVEINVAQGWANF